MPVAITLVSQIPTLDEYLKTSSNLGEWGFRFIFVSTNHLDAGICKYVIGKQNSASGSKLYKNVCKRFQINTV